MFSGKTTRLIERLREERAAGRRVAALKHAVDTRYAADQLATHDQQHYPCTPIALLDALPPDLDQADVAAFDEVHFFGRAFVPVVERLRAAGVDVIAVGLEHDAWGQPIPPAAELKPLADVVEIFTAPCMVCGAPAHFTQRMVPPWARRWLVEPASMSHVANSTSRRCQIRRRSIEGS